MWFESVDLVLSRLSAEKVPMNRIRGVSGSCQQHGSVWLNAQAENLLKNLDGEKKSLLEQLEGSLANEWSPNWQDQSTEEEARAFDKELGDRQKLAEATGSGAHHVSVLGTHITVMLMS